MGLSVVTPAAKCPVSLQEMKDHMRVDHDDENAVIQGFIASATEYVGSVAKRQFVQATYDYTLDGFPSGCRMVLPRTPLVSVASITYIDTDGVSQTFSSSLYNVKTDTVIGSVDLAYNEAWPSTRGDVDSVTVRFVAGYADIATVPHAVKTAIKLLAAHWHEHRESVVVGTIATNLPMAVDSLLDTVRVLEVH